MSVASKARLTGVPLAIVVILVSAGLTSGASADALGVAKIDKHEFVYRDLAGLASNSVSVEVTNNSMTPMTEVRVKPSLGLTVAAASATGWVASVHGPTNEAEFRGGTIAPGRPANFTVGVDALLRDPEDPQIIYDMFRDETEDWIVRARTIDSGLSELGEKEAGSLDSTVHVLSVKSKTSQIFFERRRTAKVTITIENRADQAHDLHVTLQACKPAREDTTIEQITPKGVIKRFDPNSDADETVFEVLVSSGINKLTECAIVETVNGGVEEAGIRSDSKILNFRISVTASVEVALPVDQTAVKAGDGLAVTVVADCSQSLVETPLPPANAFVATLQEFDSAGAGPQETDISPLLPLGAPIGDGICRWTGTVPYPGGVIERAGSTVAQEELCTSPPGQGCFDPVRAQVYVKLTRDMVLGDFTSAPFTVDNHLPNLSSATTLDLKHLQVSVRDDGGPLHGPCTAVEWAVGVHVVGECVATPTATGADVSLTLADQLLNNDELPDVRFLPNPAMPGLRDRAGHPIRTGALGPEVTDAAPPRIPCVLAVDDKPGGSECGNDFGTTEENPTVTVRTDAAKLEFFTLAVSRGFCEVPPNPVSGHVESIVRCPIPAGALEGQQNEVRISVRAHDAHNNVSRIDEIFLLRLARDILAPVLEQVRLCRAQDRVIAIFNEPAVKGRDHEDDWRASFVVGARNQRISSAFDDVLLRDDANQRVRVLVGAVDDRVFDNREVRLTYDYRGNFETVYNMLPPEIKQLLPGEIFSLPAGVHDQDLPYTDQAGNPQLLPTRSSNVVVSCSLDPAVL